MADEQDKASKTEEPTTKKLTEARNKGQVPISKEVNTWAILFAAALFVLIFLPGLMANLGDTMRVLVAQPHAFHIDTFGLGAVGRSLIFDSGVTVLLPMLMFLLVGVGISLVQTQGFIFSGEKMKPDLSKLSPVKGFTRLFGKEAPINLLKAIAKLVMIAFAAAIVMVPRFDSLDAFVGQDLIAMLLALQEVVLQLMVAVLSAAAFLAVIDLILERRKHNEQLKMTKQEVRDEHKQSEGDPAVKAKIRQIRFERARQRIAQAVPRATVVLTNPTHFAVALSYEPETMAAPVVVAKGVDVLARRIREIAEENDIPVIENPPLARALHAAVEIDQEVPPEHYKAVAEVISYVFGLSGRQARREQPA